MQENKKNKGSGMWIFLLIIFVCCGVVVYTAFFKDKIGEANSEPSRIEVGTVYEYTDEEVQNMIDLASKQLEEDKLRYKIKPGYSILDWKKLGDNPLEKNPERKENFQDNEVVIDDAYYYYEKDGKTIWTGQFGHDEKLPSEVKYKNTKMKESNSFNDDLSLKIADAFYGYGSVGNPYYYLVLENPLGQYLERGKTAKDYVLSYQSDYENFMGIIEAMDEMYKNNNEQLLSGINRLSIKDIDNLQQDAYGGTKLFKEIYRDLSSVNSMNPLQTILASNYNWNLYYYDLIDLGSVNLGKYEKLDYYPEGYNYFAYHNNYFFYYYPTRVEKVSDNKYLIDVETSLPATRLAIEEAFYQITSNFNRNYGTDFEAPYFKDYDSKFDIIVRINNTNMNKGMILDYAMGSVLYPNLLGDSYISGDFSSYDRVTDKGLRCSEALDYIPWYPNEEAQKLLSVYFTYAKEAFDSDSFFSIVETIERSAKDLNMELADAKKIIYSYYLYCNYGWEFTH